MTSTFFPTLQACCQEIGAAVQSHRRRGYSGQRETQYHLDLVADEVAVRLLTGAGWRVISEESGTSGTGEFTIVVDPIDGSTNCDQGIPFYATSLAVLHGEDLVAGMVMNQATGTVFYGERGAGATRDEAEIHVSGQTSVGEAIMAFSGLPERHIGWGQNRALGAASLEICLVADGSLDVFAVAQRSVLHPWDYLAGLLILREAGGVAGDYHNEGLVTAQRQPRHPYFAASSALLDFMTSTGPL